jgi:hypothetical protein
MGRLERLRKEQLGDPVASVTLRQYQNGRVTADGDVHVVDGLLASQRQDLIHAYSEVYDAHVRAIRDRVLTLYGLRWRDRVRLPWNLRARLLPLLAMLDKQCDNGIGRTSAREPARPAAAPSGPVDLAATVAPASDSAN